MFAPRGEAPYDSQSLWVLWLIKPGECVNVTPDDSQHPVLWGRGWKPVLCVSLTSEVP